MIDRGNTKRQQMLIDNDIDDDHSRKRQRTIMSSSPANPPCRLSLLQSVMQLVAATEDASSVARWNSTFTYATTTSSPHPIIDNVRSSSIQTKRTSWDACCILGDPSSLLKQGWSSSMMGTMPGILLLSPCCPNNNHTGSTVTNHHSNKSRPLWKKKVQLLQVPTTNRKTCRSSLKPPLPSGKPLLAPPRLPRVKLGEILPSKYDTKMTMIQCHD